MTNYHLFITISQIWSELKEPDNTIFFFASTQIWSAVPWRLGQQSSALTHYTTTPHKIIQIFELFQNFSLTYFVCSFKNDNEKVNYYVSKRCFNYRYTDDYSHFPAHLQKQKIQKTFLTKWKATQTKIFEMKCFCIINCWMPKRCLAKCYWNF